MSSPAPIDSEAKVALQKVLDDPVGSVELASQPDKRDELSINALVVGVAETRLWPQFREAGVARLFVQLLVDGWRQGGRKDEVRPPYRHGRLSTSTNERYSLSILTPGSMNPSQSGIYHSLG